MITVYFVWKHNNLKIQERILYVCNNILYYCICIIYIYNEDILIIVRIFSALEEKNILK